MRPLQKLSTATDIPIANLRERLFASTGPYCHLCESSLPDHSYVAHKHSGEEVKEVLPTGWDNILLLCKACFLAQKPVAATALLYPDEKQSFSLDAKQSPFLYEKKMVTQFVEDAEGNTISEPETLPMVLVKAQNPEASATLDRFQLNSPYYNEADNTFRISPARSAHGLDIRVHQRTKAWDMANDFADRYLKFRELSPQHATLMLEQGRSLAAAAGFWSVWATLLWKATSDRVVLTTMLLPVNRMAGRSAAVTPEEHYDAFQGTLPSVFSNTNANE